MSRVELVESIREYAVGLWPLGLRFVFKLVSDLLEGFGAPGL